MQLPSIHSRDSAISLLSSALTTESKRKSSLKMCLLATGNAWRPARATALLPFSTLPISTLGAAACLSTRPHSNPRPGRTALSAHGLTIIGLSYLQPRPCVRCLLLSP
jgi:hypothetical protein